MSKETGSSEAISAYPPQFQQYFLEAYEELRALAERQLAKEDPGQTLQATALVHEAYVRLVGNGKDPRVNDQHHFYAMAAEAMRHVLIDTGRRRKSLKRGGGRKRTNLVDDHPISSENLEDLLALDDAIIRLGEVDPESAHIVRLRCYGGHSLQEAAEVMGISRTSAYRLWAFARAWLLTDFGGKDDA